MLVEINLLPKKEPRKTSLFMLACVLVFILFIGIGAAFWIGQSYMEEINSVTLQQSQIQQQIAMEQEEIANADSLNSVEELEKAVRWAEDYPIKTVPVLRKFTALLPERGFIKSISFKETGNIIISVQFDTSREASYYLKTMIDSNWIENATINSLSTVDLSVNTNEQKSMLGPEMQQSLPRYLAEYEVVLNRDVIKQDKQAAEKGEDKS